MRFVGRCAARRTRTGRAHRPIASQRTWPLVALIALAACSPGSAQSVLSDDTMGTGAARSSRRPSTAPGALRDVADAAWTDEATRDTVNRIIRELGLDGGLSRACYGIEYDATAEPVTVHVREIHDDRCGGDPNTAPRVSTMQWVPTSGAVITDYWGLVEGRTDTLPARGRVAVARRLAARSGMAFPRDSVR